MVITSMPYDPQALIDFSKDFSVAKIALVTDDWALCDEIKVKTQKMLFKFLIISITKSKPLKSIRIAMTT